MSSSWSPRERWCPRGACRAGTGWSRRPSPSPRCVHAPPEHSRSWFAPRSDLGARGAAPEALEVARGDGKPGGPVPDLVGPQAPRPGPPPFPLPPLLAAFGFPAAPGRVVAATDRALRVRARVVRAMPPRQGLKPARAHSTVKGYPNGYVIEQLG